MNTTRTLLAVGLTATLTLPVAGGLAQAAQVAAKAKTTVTIKAEGTDLSGKVKSPRAACKDGRKVIVFKQVGARGGGNDKRFASDTAETDGSWNTGNTGTAGRFYAKVRPTGVCKGDTSRTIRATR
jgi:hypothetical protein